MLKKEKKYPSALSNLFYVVTGNALAALAVTMFVLPNGLIMGGATGLSFLFHRIFSIPISIFLFVFNVFMLLIGTLELGRTFAATTLLSTFLYPSFIQFFQRFSFLVCETDEPLLAVFCGAILMGFSIGIVLRVGSSTGGMDIPPLILKKRFHIPVTTSIYAFDLIIILLQSIYYKIDDILYGILFLLLYTFVIDKVLLRGQMRLQIQIISSDYDKITSQILCKMNRGATLLLAETGFYHSKIKVILTVISPREFSKLNEIVMNIDPTAFLIIDSVNEIRGRGFSFEEKTDNYLDSGVKSHFLLHRKCNFLCNKK